MAPKSKKLIFGTSLDATIRSRRMRAKRSRNSSQEPGKGPQQCRYKVGPINVNLPRWITNWRDKTVDALLYILYIDIGPAREPVPGTRLWARLQHGDTSQGRRCISGLNKAVGALWLSIWIHNYSSPQLSIARLRFTVVKRYGALNSPIYRGRAVFRAFF